MQTIINFQVINRNLSTCSRCQRPLPWLPKCLLETRTGSAWWWRNTAVEGALPRGWSIRTARSGNTAPPSSSVPRNPPYPQSYRRSGRWYLLGNTCKGEDVTEIQMMSGLQNYTIMITFFKTNYEIWSIMKDTPWTFFQFRFYNEMIVYLYATLFFC